MGSRLHAGWDGLTPFRPAETGRRNNPRARPLFATLPGVSAPPPFAGSARTILINVKPDRLRAYGLSSVYMPVTKRSDASTLTVLELVKQNLGKFKAPARRILPSPLSSTIARG